MSCFGYNTWWCFLLVKLHLQYICASMYHVSNVQFFIVLITLFYAFFMWVGYIVYQYFACSPDRSAVLPEGGEQIDKGFRASVDFDVGSSQVLWGFSQCLFHHLWHQDDFTATWSQVCVSGYFSSFHWPLNCNTQNKVEKILNNHTLVKISRYHQKHFGKSAMSWIQRNSCCLSNNRVTSESVTGFKEPRLQESSGYLAVPRLVSFQNEGRHSSQTGWEWGSAADRRAACAGGSSGWV